jgi:hypothetical protein
LYVQEVNDIRQTEIHTAEPQLPEKRAFEFELDIEDIESHISPGVDQIPAEMFKAGGRKFPKEFIILLFLFEIRRIA